MALYDFLKLYPNDLTGFKELSDAEFGRLIRAGLLYVQDETETKLKGNERFLFPVIQNRIDTQED